MTFHELGHFYIARRCGVKVLRFSVGFGRPLFSWTDRHGTEFVVAAIPLGGYVKMLDEREGEVSAADLPMAFTQKTVWQRMAIICGGPIANFILAVVFYFVLALGGMKGLAPVVGEVELNSLAAQTQLQPNDEIVSVNGKRTQTWSDVFEELTTRIGDTGFIELELRHFSSAESSSITEKKIPISKWLYDISQPDVLSELGIKPYQPDTDWLVQTIISGGPAEASGLIVGDKLIAADGESFSSWGAWVDYVRARPGELIRLQVERAGEIVTLDITPEVRIENDERVGRVGLATSTTWPDGMVREINYSFFGAISYGVGKTWDQALVILSFLKKLILLDVSVKNMGGTFTIAQVAGDTAAAGMTYYFSFLAFFSVSLGVFNLLPIPVLDGGHLMFYIIEAIMGRPLPERVQDIGYHIGLFIVVSVMIIAHYNDLVRLLS